MIRSVPLSVVEKTQVLRGFLRQLKETPSLHRGYVVVQDAVTGRFVQYAGGDAYGPTLFDVPGRKEYPDTENPIDETIQRRSDDVDELVGWAIEALTGPLRLPITAEVSISIDTTEPGKDS